MRIARLIFVVVLLLSLCLAVASADQKCNEADKNVMFHAGTFFPTDSDLRDALGSYWLDLGFDFKVASGRDIDHWAGIGYIGSFGKDLSSLSSIDPAFPPVVGAETDFYMIPITYTQRTRPNPNNKLYIGGGAGGYFTHGKVSVTTAGGTEEFTKSDANFELHILGGYQFSDSIGLEAKFVWFVQDSTIFDINGFDFEANPAGASLALTARF